jgi:hypothetical protein
MPLTFAIVSLQILSVVVDSPKDRSSKLATRSRSQTGRTSMDAIEGLDTKIVLLTNEVDV